MKIQIIQIEPYDDTISVKDKMGWGQTGRVVLVWPTRGRLLDRRLDLVLILRHSQALSAQIALVTSDPEVRFQARSLDIPVYQSVRKEILPLRIRKNNKFRGEFFLVVKYVESKNNDVINYIGKVLSDRLPGYKIEFSFYEDNVASLYINEKKQLSIISVGIIAAMIIAILGLIAISLFSIRQRVKEFGIRKVNGAKVSELLLMVNKSFIKWVIFSFVLACPVVYYVISKWLNNFAYKTEISWWVFLIGGFLALFITIVTISIQSYKTTIKNPVEALRYE